MVNTNSFFFNYASTRRIGLRGNDGPGSKVKIKIMGLLKSTAALSSSFQRKLESRKVVPGCLDKLWLSQIRAAQRIRVVIPACKQAGMDGLNHWIPAFAGMTNRAT